MSESSAHPEQADNPSPGPLIALLVALQFLTISPAIIKRVFTPRELGRATGFFPLVGLLIGFILLAANLLLAHIFAAGIRAALVLALWILLSGGLHLDGFLDACDGLLGGYTPESRLEIMRDERVGAFALAGGILLLLVKYSALLALPVFSPGLWLAPVMGRWGMTAAIYFFPYARLQGLGKAMKDHTSRWEMLLASLLAVASGGLSNNVRGLVAFLLAAGIVWAGARFTLRRIPGLTGDIYGALNELVEAGVLLVFTAGVISSGFSFPGLRA
jgi:adenosylcobinamide-GDP ribazoletransferase